MASAEDFAPCRDEKCPRTGIHPAHQDEATEVRQKLITTCPECDSLVIKIRGTRGRCLYCPWRGSIAIDRPIEEAPIMKKLRNRGKKNA